MLQLQLLEAVDCAIKILNQNGERRKQNDLPQPEIAENKQDKKKVPLKGPHSM